MLPDRSLGRPGRDHLHADAARRKVGPLAPSQPAAARDPVPHRSFPENGRNRTNRLNPTGFDP
jgi:hypothetical protein